MGRNWFKKHQSMNQSRGATASDLRISDPIRSRIGMGATDGLFEDADSKGDGKAISTKHQSYSARIDVGASTVQSIIKGSFKVKERIDKLHQRLAKD